MLPASQVDLIVSRRPLGEISKNVQLIVLVAAVSSPPPSCLVCVVSLYCQVGNVGHDDLASRTSRTH